jgi:hypothetical protein
MPIKAAPRFCFIINSIEQARFDWFEQGFQEAFGPSPPPVVRVPDAKSMCEGYNRGARQATDCDWFVFCHDDVRILSPEPLACLARAAAVCDMFGVAGTRRMVSGNWYDAGAPYTLGQVVARAHDAANRYELQLFGESSGTLQHGALTLDGIFIACRRSLFEQLGGFDEAGYRGFVGYDMDFTFRAALAGARVAVAEDILVLHDSTVADFHSAKIAAWEDAQRRFVATFEAHLSKEAGKRGHRTIPLGSPMEALRHIAPPEARRNDGAIAADGGIRPVTVLSNLNNSDIPRSARGDRAAHGHQTMQLACFTMFRNEAAILGPFLDQLTTFFDHAILVNHGSTDGGPAMVEARNDAKLELLQLQAPGYPQSELATGIARLIFERHDPDFLFFLDCDEFLPFPDRAALEAFLEPYRGRTGLTINWQHVCPTSFKGGNIFAGSFLRAPEPAPFTKLILGRRVTEQAGWVVDQGYHGVHVPGGPSLDIARVTDIPLLHMPVQTQAQFRFKIAAGARRLRRDAWLIATGNGRHWLTLDQMSARGVLDDTTLRNIALGYPELPEEAVPGEDLDFNFPYVHSPYREDSSAIAGQLEGLLQVLDSPQTVDNARSYSVLDTQGTLVLSSGDAAPDGPQAATPAQPQSPVLNIFSGTLAEEYAALVEPLFNLPTKLPTTAWSGHIPFLFVLFQALRPRQYVDLGVHFGASLIGAATASRTYGTNTHCVGVDTWQGDDHAGRYDGDRIYHELDTYVRGVFTNVSLIRSLFIEARKSFRPGSIDILHVDGLHTYDAVKEDFATWFDRMSPQGVVMFHDTNVHRDGFGVHRLWAELKAHFPSMEFFHSHGLGVLFLCPEDVRFAPFRKLMRDERAMRAYQSLAADIGGIIEERMVAFAAQQPAPAVAAPTTAAPVLTMPADSMSLHHVLAEREAHLAAMHASTSWRVTAPLRAVRRLLGE